MLIVTNQDGPGMIVVIEILQVNEILQVHVIWQVDITRPGNIAGRANITSPGTLPVHDLLSPGIVAIPIFLTFLNKKITQKE